MGRYPPRQAVIMASRTKYIPLEYGPARDTRFKYVSEIADSHFDSSHPILMPSRIPGLPLNWLRPRMLSRTRSMAAIKDSATTKFPMNLQILEPNEQVAITRRFDTPEALKIYVSAYKRAVLKAL